MRVLFLDFDGVLNSHQFFGGDGRHLRPFGAEQIDPAAVQRLNTIVERTGCVVVVSSSWRYAHRRTGLCDILKGRGFIGKVIGVTPSLMVDERHVEIRAWLAGRTDVDRFVILDDDHTAGVGFGPQFVWTSFVDGLTDEKASKAIEILLREDDHALRALEAGR